MISLRNQAHHPGIPDSAMPEKVTAGMVWLEQVLTALQFLSAYQVAFMQRIEVAPQRQPPAALQP